MTLPDQLATPVTDVSRRPGTGRPGRSPGPDPARLAPRKAHSCSLSL